jgi:hypothetical protein
MRTMFVAFSRYYIGMGRHCKAGGRSIHKDVRAPPNAKCGAMTHVVSTSQTMHSEKAGRQAGEGFLGDRCTTVSAAGPNKSNSR